MKTSMLFCAVLATFFVTMEAGAAPPGVADSGATLARCPASLPFPNGVEVLKAIRVYKAANGESAFETVEFKGESKAYFKPGELFTHNLLANAAKIQIVSGPANAVLPLKNVANPPN